MSFTQTKTSYIFPVCSSFCSHNNKGQQPILRTKPASKQKWECHRGNQVEWEKNLGKIHSPIICQGDSDGNLKVCLQAITWLLSTHKIRNELWVAGVWLGARSGTAPGAAATGKHQLQQHQALWAAAHCDCYHFTFLPMKMDKREGQKGPWWSPYSFLK